MEHNVTSLPNLLSSWYATSVKYSGSPLYICFSERQPLHKQEIMRNRYAPPLPPPNGNHLVKLT